MNEQERSELMRLKQRQSDLQKQLERLGQEIHGLDLKLSRAVMTAPPIILPLPETVPPAGNLPRADGLGQIPAPGRTACPQPPPLPIAFPPGASDRPGGRTTSAPAGLPPVLETSFIRRAEAAAAPAAAPAESPAGAPPSIGATAAPTAASFEMRLGTYWLVRIGVIMLLSALAFFGYYAYEHFIPRLGRGGKVALLYLASGALLGAGAWCQRPRFKESLRNYGQVLLAGGLAAVYFTTYAAHHLENLRVIASPVVDGALLLGWAGFMVWLADRRRSEVLALFAIGLAYYTSVITRIGSFTLYSNLLLSLAAVAFLIRNRWATLSFASLVATYVGYGFWWFVQQGAFAGNKAGAEFWQGNLFLSGYWLVFCAGGLLSKGETLTGGKRGLFLSLNNGAFFALVSLSFVQAHREWFWAFSLGFGALLLGLAELCSRLFRAEPAARNSALTQGLVLVTLGLIAKFTGLQLALLLAAQSVVLLIFGERRQNNFLRAGAMAVAALGVLSGLNGMKDFDRASLLMGVALGAFMTFNAWWTRHRDAARAKTLFHGTTSYFVALALLTWLVATWRNTSSQHLPLVLAAEGLALTASVYLLRLPEVSWLSQGYVLLGHVLWLGQFVMAGKALPWWNPALLIGTTVALSHWWQRQTVVRCDPKMSLGFQSIYALAIVSVLCGWLGQHLAPAAWLATSSALALGVTAYGVATRAWPLALGGQVLLLVSIREFGVQLLHGRPAWFLAAAPIAALALLSLALEWWLARQSEVNRLTPPVCNPDGESMPAGRERGEPWRLWARLYRWGAVVLTLWWVHAYVPAREQFWALTLLGLAAFAWAGWRRHSEGLLIGAVFTLVGLVGFWLPLDGRPTVYWPNVAALLTLMAQQQMARQFPDRYRVRPSAHSAAILLGGLSLWLCLSRWVRLESGGFYITVSWSVLALGLLVTGLALRERMYRWLGLGVLACALGRVVIFEVWKLQTLNRIFSFMALGVVLLVLGFIYNKYQEKIRQWL